jgi:hypothetical protein
MRKMLSLFSRTFNRTIGIKFPEDRHQGQPVIFIRVKAAV